MALTAPILDTISPFDAAFAYTLRFASYGGDQVVRNKLVISNAATNAVVYDAQVESFLFQHIIPAGILVNGVSYRASVQTGNAMNEWSAASNNIVFKVSTTPVVSVTNVSSGLVNNQSFSFVGSYSQAEGELLESFRFNLYSQNDILFKAGDAVYGTPTGSYGALSYMFDGMQNNSGYFIELMVRTVSGMEVVTPKYFFTVQFFQPIIENVVHLENIPEQGGVMVSTQVVRLIWEHLRGDVFFEADEWVNLKNGAIYIEDGFDLNGDFTLKLWVKDIPEEVNFLSLYTREGFLCLFRGVRYGISKIYAFKKIYAAPTAVQFVYSGELTGYSQGSTLFICLQKCGNRIAVSAEVVT